MTSKTMEFRQLCSFLWILCLATASQGTQITHTCSEGWVLSGTMCYRLYGQDTLTSSTWDNAYRVCKGNGAEMVTIDDYFTNKNVGDFASVRNTNKFWTGMSEKGVTTQNGIATTWNMKAEASIYQGRWSVRNPDTTFGDCVYIEKKDGDYVWTVGSCLMKMAFMCQRTSCLPQSFHCDNGRCVNSNWRCDGVDDCGDFSDEVECAGRCSYLLDTANSGRIQSPNHPSNYQPSRVCTWTIVGPEGSNIYLEFTSFNTEKDTDIVEVLIGGRTESTARSVARLSGQPSLSTARYRSYNNYMIIRFSTDSQTEKVGFTANYNSSRDSYPEELYMTARTTVSTLEPPLFSSHGSNAYLGNRDYVWIIRAEERRKIVTLERMKIDLMGDDVIEIRDGDSGSAPLLEKYTASNNDNVDLPLSQSEPIMGKRFVFSTSNVMYVIMRTSGSTSGTGFSFQYRQGCVARYTADAGEITSPGYPNVNYANFQTCTWTIDIPSGKGVKVMLDRSKGFEIADNEDFIEIYTNSTDDSGIAAHGSGAGFTTISLSNDQPFHSPNGKMFIRFKSTAITNKKGFRFLYSVDCPDPGLTEASEMNPSQTALQLRQFDNEFTVSCKNGYSFYSDELNLRTARMKCMYGGKWLVEQRTRTIPQCKPNYCGEPVAVENGYISHSSGVVFGSFVTFTCFPGFSLLGSANITCQANQWTSRPQCVSASCPAPSTISDGRYSSSGNQYAAIVNYTCNAGYQLIGAPILFCQYSGQWTASAPQCIKITCPIPEIKNGRVSSSTLPKFQETLTVTCDVGYVVNGSATITCGDDRNFDAVPNCITEVCPIKSLRPVLYADINCEWIEGNATCTYSCKSGYVYYDGTTSKDYHCSGENNWSPSANPEECLLYEILSYKAKLEVRYSTTDIQASDCLIAFEKMLAADNTTIAKAIEDKCKDLNPGDFVIRSFSLKALFFKITTVISGEFIGDRSKSARDTCINYITIISPSFILPVSSVTCSGNQQTTFTVESIGSSEAGNKCSDNMVLVNNQICVQCPPGRYFNGTTCVMCSEGQYQNLPGQSSCKSCDDNTVSNVDKTTCIAKNCSLKRLSGSWAVPDDEIGKTLKLSLESCKTYCEEDVKCNAMYYIRGFCLVVYIKTPTVSPYHDALYFDKVCNHTYDIDKCYSNNGGCSQLCTNSLRFYTCSCNQAGYVLFDVDGRSGYTIQSPDDGNRAGDVYHLEHSCVRQNCSEPAVVNNAMLMTKRAMHRYMDKITYMCDLGYVKSRGEDTFTCGSDGQWTPSQTTNLLECSVATCPVSDLNTLNLKNRPTLSTTNPVSYLDYLNMTCDVPAKGTFVNQQQCLYDKTTNTYALFGAPYECGVIDCGNPVQVPGSSYSTTPSSTIYGATFTFTCENLQTRKGSSSTTNDNSVTCMADGNWDFGTLRCEGTTCTDPGYPNGGYLSTDVTGFEQNKVVTFGCNLAGFTVPANSALKCVLNSAADGLRWNGTTPTECQDTTAPVVSGCPGNMNLGRYHVITHNRPVVSDNSRGIKTFEVSPRNANTTLVLEESPITITYTATDFNGNQDSCSFTVNVTDEEPPKVTCPSAKTETVVDTEVRTFTLDLGEIVSSDNSGQPPTVEISPQSLTISANFIGITREMTVTVRDSTGRTDQCRVQVYTAAAACSPLSLETPLFGQKNCSATNSGYKCDLKCDQTYTFYDSPGLDVKTLECTNGGAWPQRIPACTPETQEALYTSLITVTYGVETAGQTIGSSCFDSTYKSVLSTQTPQTESNLKQGCSGGLFTNDNIFIDIDEESSFATSAVTVTTTSLSIIYTVKQTPLGYRENLYSTCSNAVFNRMQSFDISISKILSTTGGCPNLVRTSAIENSKGFICSSEKKKVTVNQKDYCLDCPAGTYLSAPNTCVLCPVNTYKGNSGSLACTQCGSGGTQRTGSTSQGQCQAKCAAGTFSVSGMPPCNQCARNSYWSSSTSCTACPNDGKTSSAGAVSVGSCINKCSAGSYSYDGYAPCRSCPKNYYQDQTGATSCTRCPNTQSTASIGSSASSSCQNAMDLCSGLNCQNGGTCVAQDNEAICNCPIGYYGSRCENKVNYCIQGACYNGGTCVSGATSYTCTCPSGTTGARCETDATDDCATAPCKNGGMCVNQLYNYRCLCTSGYSGTTCSSQTSKCNEQPCNSVGTAECINYDNIRRICKCKAGYTGQDCETNIDDCASNPCLYGGTCTDLVGGYSCTCPTGYQGTRCQNRVNPCSLNRCSNGQCVDAYSMDLFKCICQPGYQYGLICPYEMYNGNGTSLTPFSTPIGTITIGNCRQQCDNLQICQAYTFAAGTCKLYQTAPTDPTITAVAGSTLNIKKCIYPDDDYWSPWYDQGPPNGGSEAEKRVQLSTYGVNVCNGTEPIDAECRVVGSKVASSGTGDSFSLPCGVDGIECNDQVNNPCEDYEVRYKCAVYKGFQSNTCDVKNHCLSNPCMNGGACSYRFKDFACSCPTGYTGKLCQHDVDSCQTNPCRQGGTCIDRPGSQGYECQCPAGYGGSICQSNINECSSNPCDPVGSFKCSDAVNDYMCDCKPGYTGKNCSTEINECDAEPCMHGGNCTDRVNDFQCTCPEGWTGKRCEMIYDECTVNNKCPSSSQCLNIFKKSYCKCPKNTYGEVCENSPNICRDLRPCLNSATCTAGVNALSKCTCPNDDYRGIGCEIMVNHCGDPNKCENGGTCVNLAPGFRCDCPPGYSGANCSINVNDCSNNCPSTSTCIDMVNAHYCRCPLGKTGESCVRDLDPNYDLYFYRTSQDGYAALPYPIYLSGSSFSLSVWVRFYQSSLTGTFLTIFTAKSANSLAGVTKFLSLDHQGLVVYDKTGQNPQRAAYQQQTVTDGQWNYVVVSWNKDNGFDLVVNSLRQSQIPTTPYTTMMAENIWVTLGADFDSTIMPKANDGFRGYVSQLNIYNRGLSFENEMPQLIPDPRKVFSGSILRWNEFVYHRGVQPVYLSSAQKPFTGANCVTYNKEFPIFTTPCPSNVYKVSADRLTSVTWTEPIPQGATIQESTYKSGDTFLWGKYTNTYAIRDAANSSASCSFNIYVMREQCPDPNPPHLGTRSCERSYNPYFGCTIGCTDANRRIDRYTPKVYTCGPSGAWNPSNRNIPLRFPSCGLEQNRARRRLVIDLAYPNISTSFCEGVKDTLAQKLKQAFASIDTRWSNQICGQPDCSDVTFVINCQANSNGRRKRQTTIISPTSVDITIPTSLATLTRSSPAETLTVEEILTRSVLESQLFDFSTTIPNGSPDLNSFTIASSESCPTGETVVDGYCVKCGPGNFFNSSTLVCEDCPVGTYQDQDDQTSCTPCPQGSTTQTVASPSSSDCKPICNPGHYQTGTRCDPCGVGFYQSQSGMFYCDPCPVGQTTRGTTSTTASECYNDCNPGYELSSNGVCVQCAIGTYRVLGTPAVCVACPSDKTTAARGSTKATDCSLTSCLQGFKRDGEPGTCVRCEKGTYQDEKWQTSCKSCGGVRYMTMNDAATQKSDCIFFCESGQEVDNSTGTPTCVNCPVGTYKDNTVDPASKCTPCPGGKLTPTTASDSINDCSIFRCGAGYRPNATGDGCDPCPYGTYQPQADQENCTMCSSGYSTYQMASTQPTDCKVFCESGKIRNEQSQTCEVCPVGYYKTNTDYKFNNCTRCPENYVTPTTGSDDVADCTVRDCPAGTKRQTGDTGCDGCLRGQYQPQPYQTSCISCPANTFTRNVNSTKATDCETFCSSGEEKKGGVCMKCTIGYFKDNNVDKFSECTLCPVEFITANNGSISQSDCNIANCSAGNYRDTVSNTCKQCATGYYQPTQWQTSCIKCPTDKTTETTGASSLNMCQLQCSPGYEDISGTCEKCKIGFYKAEYAAALCKECPTGFITSEEGTDNVTKCTVPACDPGYYLTNNNCEKCPYDKYQPEKWQSSCIECPTSYVTQKQGATNRSDCVLDCPSGEQYRPVENDCSGCERGYYRDKTDRSQITCQMCPVEFITPGERATSVTECTVKNCTVPGQYRNPSTNLCTNCPVGTYNNVKWLDSCSNCSPGFTTKQTGSTTSNDCIRDCPSGQYESQGVCINCAVGTYRDKSEGFDCKQCSSGYTTAGTGATSSANCSITNCNAGEYFDKTVQNCKLCANGTYQDQPRSENCKPCGTAGYFTIRIGSTSISECKRFCAPGYHNCHSAATCAPTANGFTCTCNQDFQGDGTNCTHMCDLGYCVYGSCIKSPKLSCQCNKGYTGTQCEVRLDPSKQSQKQNETVIIASVTAGAILMILAILIVCCVVRARKRPEKYPRQTEYTGAPVMMDKQSLYNQSFAPGPYDNFSMRSYSPGASYRGVATMPEIGYDNTGYGGDPAVYQA